MSRLEALPWIIGMLVVTSCVHEAGHAWAAWRLGDRRESIRQRKTPFTFRHISLPFTVILPAVVMLFTGFMIGGAKPVMVSTKAIGPWRMALVAIAGPAGNFLVGGVTAGIVAGLFHAGVIVNPMFGDDIAGYLMLAVGLSFFLGFLNLLPIPPLDGSRVVAAFLPEKLRNFYYSLTLPAVIGLFVGFVILHQYYPEKLAFMNEFMQVTVPGWISSIQGWIR